MSKVLVTGASGFIAKHITRELLERGYQVRASVRSDRRRAEVEALFPGAGIEFVTLDLNKDGGWPEALTGVDALIHTASPLPGRRTKNPQDVIRPAVDGTMRAFEAASAAGVDRIVLTSSCAAIYRDSSKPADTISTRHNWTDPRDRSATAYEVSKTLAERAAWAYVAGHPDIRLTVINPGGVFGPPMDVNYNAVLRYLQHTLAGHLPVLPPVRIPIVDVRDVARMHVLPLTDDSTVGKRFPANAGPLSMVELAQVLKSEYPGRRISTRRVSPRLITTMARFIPAMARFADGIERNLDVDGSDAPREMGFQYIPATEAVRTSADFLVRHER